MFLINKKTGKAEKLSDPETEDGAGRGDRAAATITRTSESRQNQRREQRRRAAVVEGEITRSSERRPAQARTLHKQTGAGESFSGDPERQSRAPKKSAGAAREAPTQSCKSYAVWLLARRDYSASNLRKKLLGRGYTDEQADEAMAFVIAHRFQDDARFAEQHSRGAENRAGNMRIEMNLRQKGIAVDQARAQVDQLGPEEERVLLAAQKYRQQVARAGMTPELKVKIYRFLAYRGFSAKSIRVAIDALHAGAGADIDEDGGESFD